MRTPEGTSTIPLAYAAEIAFELNEMRGECSEAARILLERTPSDQDSLNECALFEEALARAHRILLGAVKAVQASRSQRLKE